MLEHFDFQYWAYAEELFKDRTTAIGTMIDSYLQNTTDLEDHAIHLLFSANRWEKIAWIKEQISRGYTIVCDRYYYSGMVYSAAKKNPTLSLQWARSPDVGLPRPDRVLFLDLTAEEVEKRLGYGEEKYEKRELQETVREVFLGLLVRGEEESTDMVVIDAGHPVEEVASTLWKAVQTVVKEVECGSRKELGTVGTWSPTL
ncbi:P-loop containing nucleoside triphosphate hydrolase [Glarea lozoyensis ATCC 20868]|uniref:dTMP kinase n=1 Tax=Glarea lozoyensis (strain ATCC 20868 / MF5171) TaxID=1116229 RepID=S3CS68_GLAL2|nr:P-loop containing nucleoside triphosphate hydrolase [Glarea lozoyensis ATCC 20868]EPE27914.1 P-loop containing nucleoside triphosphate hydrolase [Glarea lozoyensis ATCC 20868]